MTPIVPLRNPSSLVRTSCFEYLKKARYVSVNEEKAKDAAKLFLSSGTSPKDWSDSALHPDPRKICPAEILTIYRNQYPERIISEDNADLDTSSTSTNKDSINKQPSIWEKIVVDWVFVMDSLNFCFWAESPEKLFRVDYKGFQYTGYYSLCASLTRAFHNEKKAILAPKYYSQMEKIEFYNWFQSSNEVEIPLLQERYAIMIDHGSILRKKFQGSFYTLVQQANHSSQELIRLVLDNFYSYRDAYPDDSLYIYKRAQILVADLYACFKGKGPGRFDDIHLLTGFADYRVPQTLVAFGVLQYDHHIQHLLDKSELIDPGSQEEMEIRAGTIVAMETIQKYVTSLAASDDDIDTFPKKKVYLSILVDFWLWQYAKTNNLSAQAKIHHTFTIYY